MQTEYNSDKLCQKIKLTLDLCCRNPLIVIVKAQCNLETQTQLAKLGETTPDCKRDKSKFSSFSLRFPLFSLTFSILSFCIIFSAIFFYLF